MQLVMVACACDIRAYCISIFLLQAVKGRSHIRCAALIVFLCPAIGGVKRHRPPVCLSVRLSVLGRSCRRRAAGLGYRHVGCLQLSHVRPAGPSADGRGSAAGRTAIGGGISSRRPRGDNLLAAQQRAAYV